MTASNDFSGAHHTDGIVMFDQLQRQIYQNQEGYWVCTLRYVIDGNTFEAKATSRRRIQALSFALGAISEKLHVLSEQIRARDEERVRNENRRD